MKSLMIKTPEGGHINNEGILDIELGAEGREAEGGDKLEMIKIIITEMKDVIHFTPFSINKYL